MLRSVTGGAGAPEDDAQVAVTSSRRCPAIWWTHDGVAWDGTMLDDVAGRHAQLIAVSCHADRMVAVGGTLDADGAQGDGPLVLASDDGGDTWSRGDVARRDASFPEGSFTGVAMFGGEWFAASTDIDGGALWTSPDGLRWSRMPGSARRFRGMALRGIAADRRCVYLTATPLRSAAPRVLASTDGHSWRPLRTGPVVLTGSDATVSDVTVMSGEVVLVGTKRGLPVIEGGVPDAVAD